MDGGLAKLLTDTGTTIPLDLFLSLSLSSTSLLFRLNSYPKKCVRIKKNITKCPCQARRTCFNATKKQRHQSIIILLTFLNEDCGLVCSHFVFRAKRCCSKGGESRLLSGRGGSWSLGLVFHRLGLVPFHFSCSLFGSPGVGWNLARGTLFFFCCRLKRAAR